MNIILVALQVDTVKRMCIQKLPQVLVIQLKRFDYDWERYVLLIVDCYCYCNCNNQFLTGKWQ